MTISVADLISVADELLKGSSEPEHRSAISRHYYAAYHRCEEWHNSLPSPGHSSIGPKGGKHQQLVNSLKSPDTSCQPDVRKKSMHLGAKLDILRIRRNRADYVLSETLDKPEATMQRDQVKSLVAFCNQP